MLFKETTLQIYRIEDFTILQKELGFEPNDIMKYNINLRCRMCLGVNQFCDTDENIEKIY